jgi:hypothetical protein
VKVRPFKAYRVVVADDEGITHEYVFTARSRRGVKQDARDWVAATDWAATLVRITLIDGGFEAKAFRLLAVAGVTLVVSGTLITTMMVIGLSLEGAL